MVLKRVFLPVETLKDELTEMGVSPTDFTRQIDALLKCVNRTIAGNRSLIGDNAGCCGLWVGNGSHFG